MSPLLAASALPFALMAGGEESPDAGLVVRIRSGDRDAFGELVVRHHRAVYAIAYRMVGRAAEAEELCQEVFLRVYRTLDRYDARRSLGPWVRTIACHHVLNHLRRRGVPLESLTPADDGPERDVPDPADGPEAALLSRARGSELQRALMTLPAGQRMALTLKYVEGLTAEEIGERLGVPRNTAKTWVFRAREAMRRALPDAR